LVISNIEDFVSYIHGDNKTIIRVLSYNGKYNKIINLENIEQENKFGDIYFYPNIGGTKKEDIHTFKDIYIDLDVGRDKKEEYTPATLTEKGKKKFAYFPLNVGVVEKYKQDTLQVVNIFPLKYTYLIETRNGYHVHYLLRENCSRNEWENCIDRMIIHFQSDPEVSSVNKLMRLPFTNWMKDKANPFPIRLLGFNDIRYTIQDIDNVLDGLGIPEGCDYRQNDKKKKKNSTIYHSASYRTAKNIDNIDLLKKVGNIQRELSKKNNDDITKNKLKKEYIEIVETLQRAVNTEPIRFSSHNEIYDYLKKQNLFTFLSLTTNLTTNSFCCIFHADQSPSAGIIQNEETGHYIYNCSSVSCGWKGTIIQITEKLTHLNIVKALNLLREIYQISYEENEWQKQQRNILDENMNFLNSEDFKSFYPQTYQRIRNYKNILYRINRIAKDYVTTEYFTDDAGNALFFSSINYLAKKCEVKNIGGFCDRLGLLTYLGLLRKLKDEEIPEYLLKRAKQKQIVNKQKERTSFFSVPSYTYDLMQFSEGKAKEFEDNHFTMKGFSREMILRTLGEEEANRVYPQMKGKPIPEFNEKISQKMELCCLRMIKEKGWTTENEIIDQVILYFQGQKNFKKVQFKKMIGDMLQKYDLKMGRANKELKKLFKNILHGAIYTIIYK